MSEPVHQGTWWRRLWDWLTVEDYEREKRRAACRVAAGVTYGR
jgi:hypothetical protein